MPTNRVPTLAEVIDNAITSRLSNTYHVLPGVVKAYYPATMDADIQIAVNDPRFDPDTDELTTEPWPICPHVRVAWPRFGAFNLVTPLNPGDPVQCFFQDLDDSAFRSNGQANDPARTLRHGSDSMFAVPWNITDQGVTTPFDFIALAGLVMTELNKIKTAFNGHVHTSAAPGSPTGGPLQSGSPTSYTPASVASGIGVAQ